MLAHSDNEATVLDGLSLGMKDPNGCHEMSLLICPPDKVGTLHPKLCCGLGKCAGHTGQPSDKVSVSHQATGKAGLRDERNLGPGAL